MFPVPKSWGRETLIVSDFLAAMDMLDRKFEARKDKGMFDKK